MEFLEAKAIAERLGFQLFADVRGDTNALRLFTEAFRQKYGKKYRCGVYMQFRADGSCYIGQSLDVDRRHKRHRELGVIVDYLAFRCWPPSVLMEKEDLCIQDALALGVPLVNKTLKCGTLKKSDDYDQIFTPDEQDLFIERIAARQTPLTQWPNFCKNAERSELRDWEIFSQHPRFMELYQKAAFYLKTTVPNPEETESVTWQCALCNEKSLQGSIRWVIKIRCGATVTFEIFHYSQAKYQYFANIAVAPDLVYEAIDSQKAGQQYLPFANLCLPPRRQPPTLKDLQINGVFRKEGADEDGPNAQAELLTRPIALVDTSSLGMLTVPFDALESVLEDDVIATAAPWRTSRACGRSSWSRQTTTVFSPSGCSIFEARSRTSSRSLTRLRAQQVLGWRGATNTLVHRSLNDATN